MRKHDEAQAYNSRHPICLKLGAIEHVLKPVVWRNPFIPGFGIITSCFERELVKFLATILTANEESLDNFRC